MAPISLRALVGHIGLSIAIFTAIVIPIGYFVVGFVNKASVLDFQAELTAARVARYIYSHNTLWQYQQVRIAEIIDEIEMRSVPTRKRIVDQSGVPVISETLALAQPMITRSAPIRVAGTGVGELTVEASLRNLMLQTGLVALLSAMLGFAMYLVLRVFPLRVLDRTLGQLEHANRVAEQRSRLLEEQNELLHKNKTALQEQNERFDAALNNMTQGLCMFDRNARLLVYNQRFLEMYRLSPDTIRPGCSLDDFLQTLKSKNSLSGDAEQYLRNMRETLANGKAVTMVVEIEDGRVLSLASQPMANGGWVSTHEDITERRRAEAKIVYMAHHDALTNLPNRVQFRTEMEKSLASIGRGENLAVLSLDLDRFKQVNDTLGHAVGDRLLQAAADRLRHSVREDGLVARLGGDEFAVLQAATEQPNGATSLATRLIESLSRPFNIDGQQVVIGASVGVSIAPVDGRDVDELLKKADMGLYRAKAEGKGTFRFFEAGMDARMQARRMLELDLRKAIANSEFELYFQPILKLDPQEIVGFEALLRWHHPERGLIYPTEFVPLAEEIGLIVPIGEWVLRNATLEAVKWPNHFLIAINLSSVQFRNRNLVQTVVSALANSGLAPERLELEITESVLLQNEEVTLATLHSLREFGVRIAMDDFGTGYSSLGYLRSFPFDKIKIDQSFIKEVSSRSDSLAIVRAVTGLGTSLGIATTAEGVENLEQLERLKLEGCNEGQGFLFSPPVPANELPALIEKHGVASRKVA
jgi:diguanylate cyclase (GGDEF)-like protein/PAS domain S-box-containing protein